MVGAIGAIPSQLLLDAHGNSESSAVSAMQPVRTLRAKAAKNALISEDDVIG